MTTCVGCGSPDATLKCPTCVKLNIGNQCFCNQECFRSNWKEHKKVHKAAELKAAEEEQQRVKEKLGGESSNTLSFSPKLAAIKVTPNDEQENKDSNFPRNLHNASEIFLMTGNVESARALYESTQGVLDVLENGPDGKSTMRLGRATICWGCGYAGIPQNADECDKVSTEIAGVCGGCGNNGETNFLRIVAEGGKEVPWMEKKAEVEADAGN